MAGRVGRGKWWGRRGRAPRGAGALLALGLLAALGFLVWRRVPPESEAERPARGAPQPPLPGDPERLRRPVYEKPPLEPGALGELGRAVRLELSPAEKSRQEESIRQHQINIYLSDRISLHRRLPERWHPLCKEKKYNYHNLPKTSVVIAFYNEAWSTLLRTVHSVLETSPDILLEEVILVDDYSDKDHLKKPLENYVAGLRKVRLIRANKREGLVRARLLGASLAKGDVLTFLDCHCECHEGWLEPLLESLNGAIDVPTAEFSFSLQTVPYIFSAFCSDTFRPPLMPELHLQIFTMPTTDFTKLVLRIGDYIQPFPKAPALAEAKGHNSNPFKVNRKTPIE